MLQQILYIYSTSSISCSKWMDTAGKKETIDNFGHRLRELSNELRVCPGITHASQPHAGKGKPPPASPVTKFRAPFASHGDPENSQPLHNSQQTDPISRIDITPKPPASPTPHRNPGNRKDANP
eukprot:GFKZ01012864.1.p1 GENE.GFKZ01012864.1~~GFKZ01012864.1.p1  ORF type:complete len:124 (+),score=5.91 GFKZ01012864.1:115-486(+)